MQPNLDSVLRTSHLSEGKKWTYISSRGDGFLLACLARRASGSSAFLMELADRATVGRKRSAKRIENPRNVNTRGAIN